MDRNRKFVHTNSLDQCSEGDVRGKTTSLNLIPPIPSFDAATFRFRFRGTIPGGR